MAKTAKGRFTIRSAGVLFFLSALFELFSLTSAVPLFGAVRTGALAVPYHMFYMALFLITGAGLWFPKQWGYKAAFAGASFYTLDKILLFFDRRAMEAYLLQTGGLHEILQMIEMESLLQIYGYTMLMSIACWWGFVLYLHIRRDYFRLQKTIPKSGDS